MGHMKQLGNKSPLQIKLCPYFAAYEKSGLFDDSKYVTDHATHAPVRQNRTNLSLSFKKCDKPHQYPHDRLQDYVIVLAKRYFHTQLAVTTVHPDDSFYVNRSASPSSYYRAQGMINKGEFIDNKEVMERDVLETFKVRVCDYNAKYELKEIEEILVDNKIRGTFNPPMDVAMQEKLIYGRQNANILKNYRTSWIQYGLVMQYGGFNEVGKRLERFEYTDSGDIKGWDRGVPLDGAMILRNELLICPRQLYHIQCYITEFLLHSLVYDVDGYVCERQTGQISGSDMTTSNNSLAHQIIWFRIICKLWLLGMGRLPSLEEIEENHLVLIYSDDRLGGHNLSKINISVETFTQIKSDTYKEFGLEEHPELRKTLKCCGRVNPDHDFLGAKFTYDEDLHTYVPTPDINKMISSLKYSLDDKQPTDVVVKALAITSLLAPVPDAYRVAAGFLRFLMSNVKFDRKMLPQDWWDLIEMALDSPRLWYLKQLGRQSSFRRMEDFKMQARASNNKRRRNRRQGGGPPPVHKRPSMWYQGPRPRTAWEAPIGSGNPGGVAAFGGGNYNEPSVSTNEAKQIINRLEKIEKNSKRAKRTVKKDKSKWWDTAASLAGSFAGAGVKTLVGLGDYELESNSIIAAATDGKNGGSVPIMHADRHCTPIQRREYIGDILSTTDPFKLYTLPLNPGILTTFPWGSQIARNYELYRVKGMAFEFRTLSSDYALSVGLGYICLATLYNSATDPVTAFQNKRMMENHEYATSGKPSVDIIHGVECSRKYLPQNELYVRSGALGVNQDIRFCDLGTFCYAVGGQSLSGQVLGELWCTYDIELYEPIATSLGDIGDLYAHYTCTLTTPTSPFRGATKVIDNIGMDFPISGTEYNSINFKLPNSTGMSFMVQMNIIGAAGGTVTSVNRTFINANQILNQVGMTSSQFIGGMNVSSALNTYTFGIQSTVGNQPSFGATLTFLGTWPLNASADIFVYQIPSPPLRYELFRPLTPEEKLIRALESKIEHLDVSGASSEDEDVVHTPSVSEPNVAARSEVRSKTLPKHQK